MLAWVCVAVFAFSIFFCFWCGWHAACVSVYRRHRFPCGMGQSVTGVRFRWQYPMSFLYFDVGLQAPSCRHVVDRVSVVHLPPRFAYLLPGCRPLYCQLRLHCRLIIDVPRPFLDSTVYCYRSPSTPQGGLSPVTPEEIRLFLHRRYQLTTRPHSCVLPLASPV